MSIIVDIIEARYEPVVKRVKELETLLEVEKAFQRGLLSQVEVLEHEVEILREYVKLLEAKVP